VKLKYDLADPRAFFCPVVISIEGDGVMLGLGVVVELCVEEDSGVGSEVVSSDDDSDEEIPKDDLIGRAVSDKESLGNEASVGFTWQADNDTRKTSAVIIPIAFFILNSSLMCNAHNYIVV